VKKWPLDSCDSKYELFITIEVDGVVQPKLHFINSSVDDVARIVSDYQQCSNCKIVEWHAILQK